MNGAFGRAAMLFVSPLVAFPAFRFIHIEHHRHTNDNARDPDHFASHGKWWQLPVRFALMDVPYVAFTPATCAGGPERRWSRQRR